MSTAGPNDTVGFETLPDRPPWATALLVAVVIALATTAAYLFRESAFWVMQQLGESHDATAAARHLPAGVPGSYRLLTNILSLSRHEQN